MQLDSGNIKIIIVLYGTLRLNRVLYGGYGHYSGLLLSLGLAVEY